MKTNYQGRFDEIKHSVEEQAEHMHERMTMMAAEIESFLSREREALLKEKEYLLDELEARKYEVAIETCCEDSSCNNNYIRSLSLKKTLKKNVRTERIWHLPEMMIWVDGRSWSNSMLMR